MTLPNIYWKCRNFKPETFLSGFEVPQRLLPGLRPGPFMSLASTATPLLSSNSAAATWPLSAAQCSGVEPQALFSEKPVWPLWASAVRWRRGRCAEGTTEVVGSWALRPFNRQRNDECFGLNSFKLCKAKYIHTQSQTHRTSLVAFCFQQITSNETLSIINSLIKSFVSKNWKGY